MIPQYLNLFRKSVTPLGQPVEGLPGVVGDGLTKEDAWRAHGALVRNGYVPREDAEAILGPEPTRSEPTRSEPSPGLLRKAANFAASAARHVAHGCPKVSEQEKVRRLALCVVCEQYDPAKGTCRKCGCALATKVSWSLERCPLNPPKW